MQRFSEKKKTPFSFNYMNTSSSSSSPLSYTPSPTSSIDDNLNLNLNLNNTEDRLCLARLTLEYQELLSRYGLCVTHLQDASKQIENLRQENVNLRIANKDLTKRYQLLSEISVRNTSHRYNSHTNFPSLSIINDFRNLNVGNSNGNGNGGGSESPTSVIELEKKSDGGGGGGGERVALPKSISIRSSGYVKANPNSVAAGGTTTNRVRSVSPVKSNDTKRVFVPGGNKEEQALEFDVFNQGMTKTELCNKWQETGACPYGEHCQFAHGINELRPVIRHPRYKTEVCRMVLAGDICPYGHRCHFRHALTEQEKFRGTTA